MHKYTVFAHICPNGKIYVGMTNRDLEKDWRGGFKYKYNKSFFADIVEYGWKNVSHSILFCGLSEREAYEKKNALIEEYCTENPEYGYNQNDGGVHARPEYVRQKISDSMKKQPVIQYTIDGKFVAKYSGTREAYRKTGIRNDYISQVCRGLRETAGGFKWQYDDEKQAN